MAKRNLSPEERDQRRQELAEFYGYDDYKGKYPMSVVDADILRVLSDVMERQNLPDDLCKILNAWKCSASDQNVLESLAAYADTLPETREAAKEGGWGMLADQIMELLAGGQQKPDPFVEIGGDIYPLRAIKRLSRDQGYNSDRNLPTFRILVNKGVQQGDHLSSTFAYEYFTEEQRNTEWERLKQALKEYQNVIFLK